MVKFIEMNPSMHFLVVDSNEANAEVFRRSLKKLGFHQVVHHTNVMDAYQHICYQQVDFIICKLLDREFDALHFLDDINCNFQIPRKPFMVFSEALDDDDQALLRESGVDAYLSIPFLPKALSEAVMATWSRYIDTGNVEYHYENARRLLIQGKIRESEAIFRTILKSNKIVSRAYLGLSRVALAGKHQDQALIHVNNATYEDPDFIQSFQLKGEILLSIGDRIGAIEAFTKAIALSPKNPLRYEVVGQLLLEMECWNEARVIYELAHSKGILDYHLKHGYATALVNLGRAAEAIPIFEDLVRHAPTEISHLNNLAVCYKKLENYNRAIATYRRALDLQPENAKILFNIGLAYVAKGKEHEALESLKAAHELEPNNPKILEKIIKITDPERYAREYKGKAQGKEDPAVMEDRLSNSKVHQIIWDSVQPDTDRGRNKNIEYIENASEEEIRFSYLVAHVELRRRLFQIMKDWFAVIIDVSEELALDTVSIAAEIMVANNMDPDKVREYLGARDSLGPTLTISKILEKAVVDDQQLKAELKPILQELRTHDGLRQTLQVVLMCYLQGTKGEESVWKDISGQLMVAEHQQIFNDLVDVAIVPTTHSRPRHGGKMDKQHKLTVLSEKYQVWQTLDAFLLALLDHAFREVMHANISVAQRTGDALARAGAIESAQSFIADISVGDREVLKVFHQQTGTQLKALQGTVEYSLMVQLSFERIRSIFAEVHAAKVGLHDRIAMKNMLLQDGVQLAGVWERCKRHVKSANEHRIFAKMAKSAELTSS